MEVGPPELGTRPRCRASSPSSRGWPTRPPARRCPAMFPTSIGMTLREPYGVCASIIPWNAPGPLTAQDIGAGHRHRQHVVLKPAEDAPLTPLLMAKLAHEAGIPPGRDQRRDRLRRRGGQRAVAPPGDPADELHRLAGDRHPDHAGVRGEPGPGAPRARRQVAPGRPARRAAGEGHPDDRAQHHPQHRPDLRRRLARGGGSERSATRWSRGSPTGFARSRSARGTSRSTWAR